MEYVPGGVLKNLLKKALTLSESEVKFYTGEILLALEHMHSRQIRYGNLKVMISNSILISFRKFCWTLMDI